ncbi:FecCD family ABC transporter permease [Alicyclobacillus contaminans]|uniref:FecCD family ABC transporter permease n=1 Tax=Alicyclobacillus contaminans TaxID=392016 RepID=UPI000554B1AD|nr:iron ABC transporter permease [Alicyclobacillus contaminans]
MRTVRRRLVFLSLLAVLLAGAVLSLCTGPVAVPFSKIPVDLLAYIHGGGGTDAVVLGAIRLPRLVLAALTGAGLAMAGVALQAIFQNPMADPSVIGVTGGASLGAVVMVQTGLIHFGLWVAPAVSFTCGLAAVLCVYRLATIRGRTSVSSLLLSGVALSSLCSAVVSLLLSTVPLQTMQQMMFWLMGGLDGCTWPQIGLLTVVVVAGWCIFFLQAPALDVLSLGEEQAEGVGVPLEWTKRWTLWTAALVVGTCVSMTGSIGFVGLIVPHILRLVLGPLHRSLLLAAAIGGAALLVWSDLGARFILYPIELNVGIVTSCLGAPFFLFLLRRRQGQRMRGDDHV